MRKQTNMRLFSDVVGREEPYSKFQKYKIKINTTNIRNFVCSQFFFPFFFEYILPINIHLCNSVSFILLGTRARAFDLDNSKGCVHFN